MKKSLFKMRFDNASAGACQPKDGRKMGCRPDPVGYLFLQFGAYEVVKLFDRSRGVVQGLMDIEEGREVSLADVKKRLGLSK